MIREELKEYFYVEESEIEFELQHFEYKIGFDEVEVENIRKSIIRELRLSKLLDGDDVEYRVSVIENLKDGQIMWESRNKVDIETLSRDPKMATFASMPSMQPIFGSFPISLDETFESENPLEINDHIEKMVIDKCKELAHVNRLKLEMFRNVEPFIIENTNDKRIVAKINMARQFIAHSGRMGMGNIVSMNPVTYTKYRHLWENLGEDCKIFQTKFLGKDEILVSLKLESDDVKMPCGFRVFYNESSYEMPINKKINHHIKYDTITVSETAENFYNLITLV